MNGAYNITKRQGIVWDVEPEFLSLQRWRDGFSPQGFYPSSRQRGIMDGLWLERGFDSKALG